MWNTFNDGLTVGTKGSEHGIIIKDEEYSEKCRITIEKEVKNTPFFPITFGIYGIFVHTVYCSTIEEGMQRYECIKQDIEKVLIKSNENNICELVSELIYKY